MLPHACPKHFITNILESLDGGMHYRRRNDDVQIRKEPCPERGLAL